MGRGLTRSQRARRAVTAALATAGFVEVLSFPFASVDELDRMGIAADDERRRLNKIINPLSETSPVPAHLAAARAVRGRCCATAAGATTIWPCSRPGRCSSPRIRRCAAPRPPVTQRPSAEELEALDRALGRQPRHLAVVLTGNWQPDGWSGAGHAGGLAAGDRVRADGRRRGRTGVEPAGRGACAVAPRPVCGVRDARRVRWSATPVSCIRRSAPLSGCRRGRRRPRSIWTLLIAAAPTGGDIPLVSGFPVAKEDVALIVDADVPAAAVERALRAGAGPLLESIALFDVYTGPQVGEGKKSLAFALRFRAPDRTLTDAETAAARDAAVAVAVEQLGAVPRVL